MDQLTPAGPLEPLLPIEVDIVNDQIRRIKPIPILEYNNN